MILDLKKIFFYFEWDNSYKYSSPREDPDKELWWFCIDDYELYDEEYLIKEYGYKTPEELEESGFYVPLFYFYVNTDVLYKKFLDENYSTDRQIVHERINEDCWSPEGLRWSEYYRQVLMEAAEAWCKKYHIRYKK